VKYGDKLLSDLSHYVPPHLRGGVDVPCARVHPDARVGTVEESSIRKKILLIKLRKMESKCKDFS
jgi:hypothetical protein